MIGIGSLILCSLNILNTNQDMKIFTEETIKIITKTKAANVINITIPTTSLKKRNLTLAIHVNGRLGNSLFEIASGVGIAEHYMVMNLKLDQINHAL